MSDIPSFPYAQLWGERCVRSVANVTRADVLDLLEFSAHHRLRLETVCYPLASANEALSDLRGGRLRGAAVLVP